MSMRWGIDLAQALRKEVQAESGVGQERGGSMRRGTGGVLQISRYHLSCRSLNWTKSITWSSFLHSVVTQRRVSIVSIRPFINLPLHSVVSRYREVIRVKQVETQGRIHFLDCNGCWCHSVEFVLMLFYRTLNLHSCEQRGMIKHHWGENRHKFS